MNKKEEVVNWIMNCLASFKVIEQWCLEHQMKDEDFFIIDGTVYCKKCNFPMQRMDEIMFLRCWCCDGCISYAQVVEKI